MISSFSKLRKPLSLINSTKSGYCHITNVNNSITPITTISSNKGKVNSIQLKLNNKTEIIKSNKYLSNGLVQQYSTKKIEKKTGADKHQTEKVILSMVGVAKRLDDGRSLLKDISLSFLGGSKIGLLGTNGSGKSSFMRILAQEDTEHDGEVLYSKGISVGFLHQEPELDADKTVEENIFDGVSEKKEILDEHDEIVERLEDEEEELTKQERKQLEKRRDELADTIEEEKLWDLKRKIAIAIDALNCPPGDSSVTTLSGGERRRVALARLLISNPDVLLLDEPTNHLDAESVAWLERFLHDYRGTVVAITHDRYFLDNVANWILEVDRGVLIPFKGNYTGWLQQKEQRLSLENKKEEGRKKAIKKELEYIKAGVKAQTKKNKNRIDKYNDLVASAPEKFREPGRISIPPCPRLGRLVFEAKDISMEFDGRTLFKNLDINIQPGSIVGIIGANGTGKSTLFRIMTGELKPLTGSIKVGETVRMGFVAQSRASMDDEKTIYEEVADGSDDVIMGENRTIHVREYISQFNFRGSEQDKFIGSLSGGERNRVHIAKMIKKGCNLLLLDEPTNDLDVDVLRNLEIAIEDYPGCAVIISHDRYFLDRLCTHIIAFEGDGKVIVHEGNYASYEEDRTRRTDTINSNSNPNSNLNPRIPTDTMIKYKVPTNSHSFFSRYYSDDIIIPEQLPDQLKGILSFKQYKRIVTDCRHIINKTSEAYKSIIVTVVVASLISLLYINIYKDNKLLILLTIAVLFILFTGFSFAAMLLKSVQPQLDQKIEQLNVEYSAKGIIIEKKTKQYFDSFNQNFLSDKISRFTYIYIHYNSNNTNNGLNSEEQSTNVDSSSVDNNSEIIEEASPSQDYSIDEKELLNLSNESHSNCGSENGSEDERHIDFNDDNNGNYHQGIQMKTIIISNKSKENLVIDDKTSLIHNNLNDYEDEEEEEEQGLNQEQKQNYDHNN
ncbi:hypothetical protein ACTA71_004610 [Dictyostelium dimigraforme]